MSAKVNIKFEKTIFCKQFFLFCHRFRNVSPIFGFKNGAWFIYLYRVPCHRWYLKTISLFTGTNTETGHLLETAFYNGNLPVVYRTASVNIGQFFIKHPVKATFQTDHRLRGLRVAVYGYACTRLQRIQHPLRSITRCSTQVMVYPSALILPCFPVQYRQQVVVDQLYFHLLFHFSLLS